MAATPKKRRAKNPNLTAERIRDEALRLIDAEGLDAFSTRRLGAALGCEAMAIYWYYPSKEALLDAVVEQLIGSLQFTPTESWIDALRGLAQAYRKLAHDHPKAFPLLATRRFASPGALRFLEGLFDMARREGLDDRAIARFYRAVASYCNGVALDELAGLREAERGEPASRARESFPRVARVYEYLGPEHTDDVFEFGLELLLEALSKAAKKRS